MPGFLFLLNTVFTWCIFMMFYGEDDVVAPAPMMDEETRERLVLGATINDSLHAISNMNNYVYNQGAPKVVGSEIADIENLAKDATSPISNMDLGGKNSSIGTTANTVLTTIQNPNGEPNTTVESTEYKNTMFGSKEDFTKAADNSTSYKSTSAAYSLANSHFRPKLKFMFYVDCELMPELAASVSDEWPKNMMFMAKTVDRPKMSVEYEDINQYNFKTRVAKNVKTEEVSITFYDDSSNYVVDFFRFVMSLWQPITRRSNTMNSDMSTGNITMLDGHGMSFSDGTHSTSDYSHRGVINTINGQIFQTIKVTQTFIAPSGDNPERQLAFLYVNPMIHSIEFNELSSEDSSSTSEVVLKFSYDAVITPTVEGMQEPRNPMPAFKGVAAEISVGNPSAAGSRVQSPPSNIKFPTNTPERESSSGNFNIDLRSAIRGGLTGGISGALRGSGIGVNVNGVSLTPSSLFAAASAVKTLVNNKNARISALSNVMLGSTYGPLASSAIKGTLTKDRMVRSGLAIANKAGIKPSITINTSTILNDNTNPGGSNGEE